MNKLTITKLKGQASFQDLGRNCAQHLGFSGSGAVDEYSYKLANFLLGNEGIEPAIEVTMGQISITADTSCKLVLTGADCCAKINANKGYSHEGNRTISTNNVFTLNPHETLSLQIPSTQLHTYIAIQGGFSCKQWLGSSSQAINEYSLGFGENALSSRSILHFPAQELTDFSESRQARNNLFHQQGELTLRFLPSLLWLSLTDTEQIQLLNHKFSISANSNRMGYRLSGNEVKLNTRESLLSKPVCFGTIQLPSDGQPIILMKDRQTIGGYPTLGTVIQTDLFRLSQKRAGEQVRFVPITLAQAQAQLLAYQQKFNQL